MLRCRAIRAVNAAQLHGGAFRLASLPRAGVFARQLAAAAGPASRKQEVAPSRDEWWGKSAGGTQPTAAGAADLSALRVRNAREIANIVEVKQREIFMQQLTDGSIALPSTENAHTLESVGLVPEECMRLLTAAMATQLVHVESRIAAMVGQGFYTIGPGGEELIAAVGLALQPTDSMALHYRHTAAQVARQLAAGRSIDQILLDRARGHVVSIKDPVTGANHCAIGGGPYDFVVTSTLASQAPPAVGRALGGKIANAIGVPTIFPSNFVSFVSVGDGSVNNAHFLAAINTAEYVKYRRFKVPVVFAISDNDLSISLRGHGWLVSEFVKKLRMPVYMAQGTDMLDVWAQTTKAVEHARRLSCPTTIVYKDVPRRFGHAATDRQDAYLTREQIDAAAQRNPLAGACAQAVAAGITTFPELAALYKDLMQRCVDAFDSAAREPKLTDRQTLLDRVSRPWVTVPGDTGVLVSERPGAGDSSPPVTPLDAGRAPVEKQVMRKHMTSVFDELLTQYPQMVYIGEDVEHGGYYLVTEGLKKKYKARVADFPPEETSLIGAAMGYSQVGLLPIVEIPYAKYLDCGADMFFEAAISCWLTAGKCPNGMVVRLQGFDRGVFGGNFHTHNSLHIPPGVDVVCFSNGPDYARGMRYAVQQALAGRMVMSVDSTNLLNLRHIAPNDDALRLPYSLPGEARNFHEVTVYGTGKRLALITYGNGVVTSQQARRLLIDELGVETAVIDCPLLSEVPNGLRRIIGEYEHVVFVDVCKEGQQPLASHITRLQSEELLPAKWRCVAAQRTYNPLGSTLTFTSVDDVIAAAIDVCRIQRPQEP